MTFYLKSVLNEIFWHDNYVGKFKTKNYAILTSCKWGLIICLEIMRVEHMSNT
jgi:hypothetical protein